MSKDRHTDRTPPDEQHETPFYVPATPTQSSFFGTIGRFLGKLFRRRGTIRGDRRRERTDR